MLASQARVASHVCWVRTGRQLCSGSPSVSAKAEHALAVSSRPVKACAAMLGGGLVIAGSVAAYAIIDPGFGRSVTFWRKAFPIYAHYRAVEWMYSEHSDYDDKLLALHRRYADRTLAIILEMRGFYVKIGQLGSQRDDFVHEEYLVRLRRLQNDVPPKDVAYVKELIVAEMGRPFEEVFSHIDPLPLGSASIGQAHRAVLQPSLG